MSRTFLVRFGGEFGRAMVLFLASQFLLEELPTHLARRLEAVTQ